MAEDFPQLILNFSSLDYYEIESSDVSDENCQRKEKCKNTLVDVKARETTSLTN